MREPSFRTVHWTPRHRDRPRIIAADAEIIIWLQETFIEGKDFVLDPRRLDYRAEMTEEAFMMLKLKWPR